MKNVIDDNSFAWKFTFNGDKASKIVMICGCGEECELFSIKRNIDRYNKINDVLISSAVDSTITFTCPNCSSTLGIKHRAYTQEEEIKERKSKIDNILKYR